MTELRTLIIPYHYNETFENKVLRDSFVASVRFEKVCERLFIKPNDVLPLPAVWSLHRMSSVPHRKPQKSKKVKPAAERQKPIGVVGTSKAYQTNNKHQPRSKSKHGHQYHLTNRKGSSGWSNSFLDLKSSNGIECQNFGFTHDSNGFCPSFGKQCMKCSKQGHFARCCRSSISSKKH